MVDAPISRDMRELMNSVAEALDVTFNGTAKGKDKKVAFFLVTANFGEITGGRANYIGNADRADTKAMMKEVIARWEGRYDQAPEQQQ